LAIAGAWSENVGQQGMPEARLTLTGLRGIPLVEAGDDLAEILVKALAAADVNPADGDVLVVTQKIVSKAEGRQVPLDRIEPSAGAVGLAAEIGKDPRLVQLILDESTEVVRKAPGVLITRNRLGLVCANAGIDQSNLDHGRSATALPLPAAPDATAARLQRAISSRIGTRIGVVISDSSNRPWRLGTVGIAIGAAGLTVLDDRRGSTDLYGRELQATLINRADAIAAAAVLVMGESTERIPAALIQGLPPPGAGPAQPAEPHTAAMIPRPLEMDLFR
jgi:coenzyme F420-0:L-glutamate ligase/coenzyme F420-1:gamma-L-glutamate ligase